jgi:5-methylcytosine-specific restriction endonuclease McrA
MSNYYGSSAWQAIRAAVVARDKYTCKLCGHHTRKPNVDHIKPRSMGGADTMDNLRTLCAGCHSRVTRSANPASGVAKGCDINGYPRRQLDKNGRIL